MKLPVMLQVYTVRDYAGKDFLGTMKKIREIGYEYVELAGLCGLTAKEVKAALDEAGLKAVSAHVALNELMDEKTLDDYKLIGCEYVAVPYLGEGSRPGDPAFDQILENIRKIGIAARERGMTLLYHNHDFEFIKMPDGSFGLDYMYNTIPADTLQTELDLCWVRVAGQDPAAYVRKYAGRAPVVHFKDYVGQKTEGMYNLIGMKETAKETKAFEFRPVGEGVQDFKAIAAAVYESGCKYVCVEQDNTYDVDPLEAAKRSFEYLKNLD